MAETFTRINPEPAKTEEANSLGFSDADLRARAIKFARTCGYIPGKKTSGIPQQHYNRTAASLSRLHRTIYDFTPSSLSEDLRWLHDNLRLVITDVADIKDTLKKMSREPRVRSEKDDGIPRCYAYSQDLLEAVNYRLTPQALATYIEAAQQVNPLNLSELWAMIPAIKLRLLNALDDRAWQALEHFQTAPEIQRSFQVGNIISSLRLLGDVTWKEILEPLMVVDHILREDPAGVYGRMDYETREIYRKAVAELAAHSDNSETEIAKLVISMSQDGSRRTDAPQTTIDRWRHVGHYLVGKGLDELGEKIEYRPGINVRFERLLRRFPDEFYIIGIEFITLVTVCALIMSLVRRHEPGGLLLSALLLLLPATQAAVEVMNYLTTAILRPRQLPKVDFSKGVPDDCATIVAVPTLLINEKQIRTLCDDLEIRYLANRDRNIHYALLTDLPDSPHPPEEDDARLDLAMRLINDLDQKYEYLKAGNFFLFHRHRVYNPREGTWMGWERKRGKLLDLNQFLRHALDPFPVKTGKFERLESVRYVLTLDSDTQLPRGSAQKMIGTMAHPLNRPVVDPERNVVVDGYGILQPRVGISVQSASRSRLAQIYSGETGFDIYARAISDVYQDLYDEGIFTGKGIYDVDALRQVLESRFPRNALLSHDLIEGAYSRAGLLSDVEVIDDYPSHYSAYNRRKHRWLRGDWQIVRWIFNKVPDETRKLVRNPISLISRWKILDNLRRSLIEPATFLLLIAGWFVLPGGPFFWTMVTLALLFLPAYFQLLFALTRAVFVKKRSVARDAFVTFFTQHVNIFLAIAFLAHQALVALDAIIRTIIRSNITHSRLLEWETATEAELGIRKRTPVDTYLIWLPLISLVLAGCLYFRPEAAPYALPFLILWACSNLVSNWINRSPHPEEERLGAKDLRFLHNCALQTWRYFDEFSTENNHWLIPDNVQLEPYRRAERTSTTNLGLLLNARQAAVEFGYLTLSEFVTTMNATLATVERLPRFHGHLVNWYDNATLKPIEPLFISSVDNGNLAASLWSLEQGCLDLINHQPLVRRALLNGLIDHHALLDTTRNTHSGAAASLTKLTSDSDEWLTALLESDTRAKLEAPSDRKQTEDAHWWQTALLKRYDAVRTFATDYAPWLLPKFAPLRKLAPLKLKDAGSKLKLDTAEAQYQQIDSALETMGAEPDLGRDIKTLIDDLRSLLPASRANTIALAASIRKIADTAHRYVEEMDFKLLNEKDRTLLSIGYDAGAEKLNVSCYDLLASESRMATFIAVSKEDIPQDNWFRLGRQHTVAEGENALISWTGTMFEYLMPTLWMSTYSNTLLDRSIRAAIRVQIAYAERHGVPWGISEAAHSEQDADGNYQYAAFGVAGLALNVVKTGSLVISPYSTFLTLGVNASIAVENLKKMARRKWIGSYGFYESADFPQRRRFVKRNAKVVKSWMAHHHGMSFLALCNLFHENVFQRWFHSEARVQATELLLQERPLRVRPVADIAPRRTLLLRSRKGAAKRVASGAA